MKPEADHPFCPDCGEKVLNREAATVTPMGVYHSGCDVPDVEEL